MKQIKCRSGNKLCGKRCIKKEWECHDGKVDQSQHKKGMSLKTKLAIGLAIVATATFATYFMFRFIKVKEAKPGLSREKVRKLLEKHRPENTLEYFEIDKDNLPQSDILTQYEDMLGEYYKEHKDEKNMAFVKSIIEESKPHSVKSLQEQFGLNLDPEIKSLIDENESIILLVDENSTGWQTLQYATGGDAKAMYYPLLGKIIIPSQFNIQTEEMTMAGMTPSRLISHELLHFGQYRKGKWFYSDEEYAQKIKNLTPVQFSILNSVNDAYDGMWKNVVNVCKGLGLNLDRSTLQRVEFEAYLKTTDWDALEELYYKEVLENPNVLQQLIQ